MRALPPHHLMLERGFGGRHDQEGISQALCQQSMLTRPLQHLYSIPLRCKYDRLHCIALHKFSLGVDMLQLGTSVLFAIHHYFSLCEAGHCFGLHSHALQLGTACYLKGGYQPRVGGPGQDCRHHPLPFTVRERSEDSLKMRCAPLFAFIIRYMRLTKS